MFRHRQSKKAKKIVQDIDEVLENGRFDKVSYRLALQEMVTTKNMDYMPCKSRILTMKGIMEALRDVDISIIGVWGMPGVEYIDDIWEKVDLEALGIPCKVKTAVVREAAKQVQKQKSIDKAMAAMMQSLDPRQIKGEFMGILDLKFDGETEPEKQFLYTRS
ncbi:disease resistance protein [Fagus crenata]